MCKGGVVNYWVSGLCGGERNNGSKRRGRKGRLGEGRKKKKSRKRK
jgi:hypothetical protein